jgi:hypothetical protein
LNPNPNNYRTVLPPKFPTLTLRIRPAKGVATFAAAAAVAGSEAAAVEGVGALEALAAVGAAAVGRLPPVAAVVNVLQIRVGHSLAKTPTWYINTLPRSDCSRSRLTGLVTQIL